jgi:hypothetical protein
MRNVVLSMALGSGFAVAAFAPASASPVNAKDLVGKKICWPNGNVSTFGAGGKYSSPMVGEGSWSMYPGGVALQTAKFTVSWTSISSPTARSTARAKVESADIVNRLRGG